MWQYVDGHVCPLCSSVLLLLFFHVLCSLVPVNRCQPPTAERMTQTMKPSINADTVSMMRCVWECFVDLELIFWSACCAYLRDSSLNMTWLTFFFFFFYILYNHTSLDNMVLLKQFSDVPSLDYLLLSVTNRSKVRIKTLFNEQNVKIYLL